MSTLGLQRSHSSPTDAFDHSISLIDATTSHDGANDDYQTTLDADHLEGAESGPSISRQWTRSTLRKELARRKYAKYQKGPDDDEAKKLAHVPVTGEGEEVEEGNQKQLDNKGKSGPRDRFRSKNPFRSREKNRKPGLEDETFIEVLYENQRGYFFCGIPLYSARSLLPFDPAEWQNAQFKDSAVDIKDAQLPDPSWRWAWRTWYVDMSHDVDEQGWEYSLIFGAKFAWHGNHPWYHSFVRRRRWLRKRVKISSHTGEKRGGRGFSQAHKLTSDYFTIHGPRKEKERNSSADRSTTLRSSNLASPLDYSDDEQTFEEISNIPTLMVAIKVARVDREKIAAVKKFLEQGGEETFYLADNITAILSDLIHQTSRRQLQHLLLEMLDDATKTTSSNVDGDAEQKADIQRRYIDNLMKAINASGVHISDQDYWSDLKARAMSTPNSPTTGESHTHALDPSAPVSIEGRPDIGAHIEDEHKDFLGQDDDIRGISNEAEIDVTPGIRRPNINDPDRSMDEQSEKKDKETKGVDKGKGKDIA